MTNAYLLIRRDGLILHNTDGWLDWDKLENIRGSALVKFYVNEGEDTQARLQSHIRYIKGLFGATISQRWIDDLNSCLAVHYQTSG